MIFVPLPLFAAFALLSVFVWFARSQDMRQRAHQLFLLLIGLYAVQSVLITLRWGYGVQDAARLVALIAPVLPVVAYLAYVALTVPLRGRRLWPVVVIPLCWLALVVAPDLADGLILLAYLGFGVLLIRLAWKGPDHVALSPLGNTRQIIGAMGVTGATLVASGLTDGYIIVDFIRNDGRNVGLVVSVLPSLFVLVVGLCAAFGRASASDAADEAPAGATQAQATQEDAEIMARLDDLFTREGLHRSEELSLRRLARRLSLPDRRVSNAINRTRGLSVSQFVNEYRIKDACDLLETTEDTVLAVSLAAGFATKSNFNREFSRVTGVSPSQWRKTRGR